jgi:hypothetical protein
MKYWAIIFFIEKSRCFGFVKLANLDDVNNILTHTPHILDGTLVSFFIKFNY